MRFFPPFILLASPTPTAALLGVVRMLPDLVGGPRWTLGNEGLSPAAPPRLALSLSGAGRFSQASPFFGHSHQAKVAPSPAVGSSQPGQPQDSLPCGLLTCFSGGS